MRMAWIERIRRDVGVLSACWAMAAAVVAADPPPLMHVEMDYGPVIAHTIEAQWPKGNIAHKGLAIRVGRDGEAAVLFDTDLMRYAAGWVGRYEPGGGGGFVDLSRTNLTSYKGDALARVPGRQVFGTSRRAGWANPATGMFDDGRKFDIGPLPAEHAAFKGYDRLGGEVVVLRYTVGEAEVLDMPQMFRSGGHPLFVRVIHVKRSTGPLSMLVCESPGAKGAVDGATAALRGDKVLTARLVGAPPGGAFRIEQGGALIVDLPASDAPVTFAVAWWDRADPPSVDAVKPAAMPNPVKIAEQPAALRPPLVKVRGERANADAVYVVDTIPIPFDNPHKSWMRTTGFDFFSDGTSAAVCTWNGDVWIVRGIDDDLDEVTWQRFASGLFEPIGLRIVGDVVYVLGCDQITRLHDVNGDGSADRYECFFNRHIKHLRDFVFDLHTDAAGNFYYAVDGNRVPEDQYMHGCMLKVSPDGKQWEIFATGFRTANGSSIAPDGRITTADNEGNWVPTSRIDFVQKGGFYGARRHSHRKPPPDRYDGPLCWIPKRLDNSSGSQAWATDDRWGPLKGMMVHTSYGMGTLMLVLTEQVEGVDQGGVVKFPLSFASGIMRARFNARDGQLYVVGLKGWQTAGARDGAFQRVRYTGGKVYMPVGLNIVRDGVKITFTQPLDRELAEDVESYQVEVWNYRWTENYGSPEYSVKEPDRQGHDAVKVLAAALSEDGRTVHLKLQEIRPVMQMMIRYDLEAADGEAMRQEIYNTVHRVGAGG